MTCLCDHNDFPPRRTIPAGLTNPPLQIASFPEWRESLLALIRTEPALNQWRARESGDLGVMLIEMWAYVCDVVSFYDEVIGREAYLRSARLDPSVRKLVGLIGYRPRPAAAATVELAATVDGKRAITVPAGAAFRSGAFDGHPPQVFETSASAVVHPLFNAWASLPGAPVTLGAGGGSVSLGQLTLKPGSARAGRGAWLIVRDATGAHTAVRRVTDQDRYIAWNKAVFSRLTLDAPVTLPAATPVASLSLKTPRATIGLWRGGGNSSALNGTSLVLSGPAPDIHTGDLILVGVGDDMRWFTVTGAAQGWRTLLAGLTSSLTDADGNDAGSVKSPDIQVPVTTLTLDADVNDASRSRLPSPALWGAGSIGDVVVAYGMIEAGVPAAEAAQHIEGGGTLLPNPPPRDPSLPGGATPGRFLLQDDDDQGYAVSGAMDFAKGVLTLDAGAHLSPPPRNPVTIHANVLTATRGETVASEVLGFGDAARAELRFKLKKKPLTYVPSAAAGEDSGLVTTLSVSVGGVKWREAASFYGVAAEAEVYVVRQDDDGESWVIFGGARRPPTNSPIVARYRFGAGAAAPPAGSVKQLAHPVSGLRGVRNYTPAFGGADREAASGLRRYGPASALLLGRVVSMADMEAAAAAVSGVAAASAEWRWNDDRQEPLAQIWYIGDPGLEDRILGKLRGLADPSTPIDVAPAKQRRAWLSLHIEVDPARETEAVLAGVRAALLTGDGALLTPARLGVGKALMRSEIFETVLATPGALAVRSIFFDERPLDAFAVTPGPGAYFDFAGRLWVNGAART